jgi:hypothetical protein
MTQTVENPIKDSKEILNRVKGKNKILSTCRPNRASPIYIINSFWLVQSQWKISNYSH